MVTDYSYNVENRLVKVTTNNPQPKTIKYYYDPFGRRLWKEVNGTRTYFMYSDEGLVAEMDATGNITKSYGYRPNSTWTTDPLFIKTGTDYYFYHNDHLRTPQKLTAMSGAVVWAAKYSSFGEATVDSTSTITNNLRFPGQYYDEETGLHYNWHRYYDPGVGRYLRVDPALWRYLGKGGSSCSFKPTTKPRVLSLLFVRHDLHPYVYANGNIHKFIDPRGLHSCEHDLRECNEHAVKNEIECLRNVLKGYLTCATVCTLGCLPTGPGYPECLVACEAACALGGVAAVDYCHLLLAGKVGLCYVKFYDCKKKCSD